MKQNPLEIAIEETNRSLSLLNEGIDLAKASPSDGLYFDGLTKRFENIFLQVATLFKIALAGEGIETLSPRGAIQEAVRLGWISNPDFWLLALDARSQSVGGTIDLGRQEYLNLITQFATEIKVITNLLMELKN